MLSSLPPKTTLSTKLRGRKKIVRTRPLPESQILKFEQELAEYPWDEVFSNKDVDTQAEIFHKWLRSNLDYFFPEKVTKMSVLDKK